MNQANTWQKYAIGLALRHETFDLDIFGTQCEHRYDQ